MSSGSRGSGSGFQAEAAGVGIYLLAMGESYSSPILLPENRKASMFYCTTSFPANHW